MQESINVQAGRLTRSGILFEREWTSKSDHALDTLAAAGVRAAGERGLDEALQAVVDAAAEVTGADAVAVRVVDAHGRLPVRASACRSEALAAELEGSSFTLEELPAEGRLPTSFRTQCRELRAAPTQPTRC